MLAFLATRLLLLIPTFFGVTLAAFSFIRLLPGDPVLAMSGERGITPERHAALMQEFGLDKPIWQQYLGFLQDIFSLDLGRSLVTKRPVLEEFLTLFPATIELSLVAMTLAILIGLPIGVLAAQRRGKFTDHTVMTFALTGYSMPIFLVGLIVDNFIFRTSRLDSRVRANFFVVFF